MFCGARYDEVEGSACADPCWGIPLVDILSRLRPTVTWQQLNVPDSICPFPPHSPPQFSPCAHMADLLSSPSPLPPHALNKLYSMLYCPVAGPSGGRDVSAWAHRGTPSPHSIFLLPYLFIKHNIRFRNSKVYTLPQTYLPKLWRTGKLLPISGHYKHLLLPREGHWAHSHPLCCSWGWRQSVLMTGLFTDACSRNPNSWVTPSPSKNQFSWSLPLGGPIPEHTWSHLKWVSLAAIEKILSLDKPVFPVSPSHTATNIWAMTRYGLVVINFVLGTPVGTF